MLSVSQSRGAQGFAFKVLDVRSAATAIHYTEYQHAANHNFASASTSIIQNYFAIVTRSYMTLLAHARIGGNTAYGQLYYLAAA
jgi:hypothetical protein